MTRWFGLGRGASGRRMGDLSSSTDGERLKRQLADYPSFEPPHRGDPASLGTEDAEENLAHFLRALPGRLDTLATLLASWDIALPADAASAEPEPLIASLHAWSGRSWSALGASGTGWLRGERSGPDIAFSLAADVAALLGELVRRGRPDWRWAIDTDPEHRRAGVETFHRVVLQAPFVPDPSRDVEFDIERTVIDRLLHPGYADQRLATPWWRAVESGLSGSQAGAGAVDGFLSVR